MKVLITGANGFLGQHLSLYMHKNKYDVCAVSRGENKIPDAEITYISLDLTDLPSVLEMIDTIQPDVIIHTAAMSKPDECHVNRENCLLHNVTATEYLLSAAKKVSARFIYISTDFIFGEGGPHSELSEPAPLNFYGESKLMAENLVLASGLKHNIVRPVFIYGSHWEGMRPSFIQWVKSNLEANNKIRVVTDQKRTPTYVNDICMGLDLLLKTDTNETFHFAGSDIISPYEMAITVARIAQLDLKLIEPVTADVFPEIVQRAKESGLKIDKARKILGYHPHSFEDAVYQSIFNKA
ncbi:MAG: SDR family oxidoreductase [Bacteroidota bacterium]